MVKERARFHRAVIQTKGVIHYENDIHVIRIRLGGHITAKDDKSLQTGRTPREFVNMGQAPRANFSLTKSPTEAPHYLGPRGAMDARRQITVGVEFRQRHMIQLGRCFRAGINEGVRMSFHFLKNRNWESRKQKAQRLFLNPRIGANKREL
jgi:hypothetical protein